MAARFAASIRKLDAATVILTFADVLQARPITNHEAFVLWQSSAEFRECFSSALLEPGFESFFWETPPATAGALDLEFECAIVAAPHLTHKADATSFASQFASETAPLVLSFGNLGGDAELVVPRDLGAKTQYAHLGLFLRTARPEQVHALWRMTGERAETWLSKGRPFWVSTSGLGVPWLHVRLDTTPKYYSHRPYRELR